MRYNSPYNAYQLIAFGHCVMMALATRSGFTALASLTNCSTVIRVFKSRRLGRNGSSIWVATVIAERSASESWPPASTITA